MVDMNLEQARHNMIVQQIRPWDVLNDQVLETVAQTPREEFVPAEYRSLAFIDTTIPLGHGEVMMEPKLEARMLQALEIGAGDTVLEIGTGSGYVTALLAKLGRHIFSVDINAEFTESAGKKLIAHGIDNVTLDTGDAANGWGQRGSFDVIAVTGSLPVLTEDFQRELNIGGRLFVIVGTAPIMEAHLITRIGENDWRSESLFETVVPALKNAPNGQSFVL